MLKIEEKMGGRGFIWALHRDRDATETGRHAVTLNQASICLEVWLVGSIKSMKSIKQAQILFYIRRLITSRYEMVYSHPFHTSS